MSRAIRTDPIRSESDRFGLKTSVVFIDRFFQSAFVQGREARIPTKQFIFQGFPWAVRGSRNPIRVMLLEILPDVQLLSGVLGDGVGDVGRYRLRDRGRLSPPRRRRQ